MILPKVFSDPSRWRFGLGPMMWLFIALFLALPFVLYRTFVDHSTEESLHQARAISTVMNVVRSYYLKNVVKPVLSAQGPVQVTENYHQLEGAIPIPATMMIELGNKIEELNGSTEFAFSVVSDSPFLRRKRPPLDEFESQAIKSFRQEGQTIDSAAKDGFWRVESYPNKPTYLRMAVPLRMEAGCVACHNSHPESPLHNWKVGDVRGIQQVSVALDFQTQLEKSYWLIFYLVVLGTTGLFAFREHVISMNLLRRSNEAMESSRSELLQKSTVLEKSIHDLNTKTQVLDKIPFGLMVMEPGQEVAVRYVNEAFSSMLGYMQREVVGLHPRFLFGPESDPKKIIEIENSLADNSSTELELTSYKRSGETCLLRWLVFPSRNSRGKLLNMVACLIDVTDIRQAEAERQRLVAELQESNKLEYLGLTIAGIAHDLNTPIGIAITSSSHMQQTAQKLLDETTKPEISASAIHRHAEKIMRAAELVTNNLLRAAKLVRGFKQTSADASRKEWREVEVYSLLDSLLLTLSPLLNRAKCDVRLSCPAGSSLYTEPGALSQVISNLLVNASLHAFEGRDDRAINITVTDNSNSVLLEIADNGIGMSEQALVNAFTPFFTTKRSSGGSGLGLFSARRVVEQVLGGQITLKSVPGQGTKFQIVLPRRNQDKPDNPR